MVTRLMGVETEYAIKGQEENGDPVPGELVMAVLFRIARIRISHLSDRNGNGLFLGNGARFYNDQGHPEYSTPECDNPWDVVRFILAGDRTLLKLSREVVRRIPVAAEAPVYKGNIDYSGSGNVWGCHESFQHKASLAEMRNQIMPHLVSRIIFTGAGGFNSRSSGIEFMISPRVAHLVNAVSCNSTNARGIYHEKDEPLSLLNYKRLHLLCGESNYSHLSSVLKIGTTALIVRLIEAGEKPGNPVALADPLKAMNMITRDLSGWNSVPLERREPMPAVVIQYHYLKKAEACLGESFMPDWAGEICVLWREVLDKLAENQSLLDTRLDWRIKHSIFSKFVATRGFTWQEISSWNDLMSQFKLLQAEHPGKSGNGSPEDIIDGSSIRGPNAPQLNALLSYHDFTLERMHQFLAMRREMFELDTKFMELGPRGIFSALDEEGVLNHQVARINRIDEAVTEPPKQGRAHVRGRAIQELAGKPTVTRVSWSYIKNFGDQRKLDLTDPFVSSANWVPMNHQESHWRSVLRRRPGFLEALQRRGL